MIRRTFRLAVVLTAAILSLTLAAAAQTDTGLDRTLSPYFFVKGDPGVDRLPLKETAVDAAMVKIEKQFLRAKEKRDDRRKGA